MSATTPEPQPGAGAALRRALGATTMALTVAAVVQELRKPKRRRRWHGRIIGVPYDFRRPTWKRIKRNWWAPRDRRILKPRVFGLGWDVNVGRIWRVTRGG